jgi:hypothetical protein
MEPSFFNASSNESSAAAGVSGPAAFAVFDIEGHHTGWEAGRKGVFVADGEGGGRERLVKTNGGRSKSKRTNDKGMTKLEMTNTAAGTGAWGSIRSASRSSVDSRALLTFR